MLICLEIGVCPTPDHAALVCVCVCVCVCTQSVATGTASFRANGTAYSTDALPNAETSLGAGDVIRSGAVVSWTWESNTMGCVQSNTASTAVKKDVHPTYSSERNFRSIRMQGQPFAYAGDVTLTSTQSSTGEYFVTVERLYGNEVNEYTMVHVSRTHG